MTTTTEKKQVLITGAIMLAIAIGMTIPILIWALPDIADFMNYIGFNQTALQIPLAWVLAAVVTVGYIVFTAKGLPEVGENLFKFNLFKLTGVYLAIATGIFEEMMFRQSLMDVLQNNGISVPLQIIISAVAFGLVHSIWILFSGNWKMGLGAMVATTVLGALCAIVFVVGRRNVLPAIMAHFVINLFIEPWMMLGAIKQIVKPKKAAE